MAEIGRIGAKWRTMGKKRPKKVAYIFVIMKFFIPLHAREKGNENNINKQRTKQVLKCLLFNS